MVRQTSLEGTVTLSEEEQRHLSVAGGFLCRNTSLKPSISQMKFKGRPHKHWGNWAEQITKVVGPRTRKERKCLKKIWEP